MQLFFSLFDFGSNGGLNQQSLGEYSSALLRIGVSRSTDAVTTNTGLNKSLVFGTRPFTALAYVLAINDVMEAFMTAGPLLIIQGAHLPRS